MWSFWLSDNNCFFFSATYGSVKEVQQAIELNTFAYVYELPTQLNNPDGTTSSFVFPIHWSIVDKSGDAIVLEYTKKEGRRVFINEVGVFTNSPTYDWHTTNLNSYVTSTLKKQNQRHTQETTMNTLYKHLVMAVECWVFLVILHQPVASLGQHFL